MAEPRNPAQIELSRRSLVPLRRQIRRDAIHLGAERPTTKALQHPAIRKIKLEHRAPLALRRGWIPRRHAQEARNIMWRGNPGVAVHTWPLAEAATYCHPLHK